MDNPERPAKRLRSSPEPSKDSAEVGGESVVGESVKITSHRNTLVSLSRSVTPPLASRSRPKSREVTDKQVVHLIDEKDFNGNGGRVQTPRGHEKVTLVRSPVQLTYIRDMSPAAGNNNDTVRLRDILGDPMIRECWQFNYLFDVDFLMNQFDADVRNLVEVKVVHGSWKKEAPNRIRIDEACARYPNVQAIIAHMPEPFGTHHSKMMILLRHDDFAQVIIHTANMIHQDWTNMCQAVWRSPLLPLSASNVNVSEHVEEPFGYGPRFKRDLLAYLEAYGDKKTRPLVEQLSNFNFGSIRAALIASVPSKQKFADVQRSRNAAAWGWPALKKVISQIPLHKRDQHPSRRKPKAHIVIQISSVASLGQTDKWLKDTLFPSLAPSTKSADGFLMALPTHDTKYSVIFPTPDEIRRSFDGYVSGASIHMKLHNKAQQMQLQYMRPYLCHWAGDKEGSEFPIADHQNEEGSKKSPSIKGEAGRRRAAPHIKTYIRFADSERMDRIDWAMITSANLSTQAWGAAPNSNGEVRICSWEIGVIVWPDLFAENSAGDVEMVPCFKSDLPSCSSRLSLRNTHITGIEGTERVEEMKDPPLTTVGFRMPYDLPLTPYSTSDVPWCATASHTEPDWLGQTWDV